MAETFSIRIATPADADAVTALLIASYSVMLAGGYDAETLARTLPVMTRANPKLLEAGTYYVVVSNSGSVIGCGGWTAAQPGTGAVVAGEAHIRHVATHPDWARRGVGNALLARCFDDARARGVTTLHCYSTLNAERFYQAAGFTTVAPLDVTLGPGVILPSVLMRRAI